jgi:hypothetical protein
MSDLNTITGPPASFSKIALTSVGGLPISLLASKIRPLLLGSTPISR